MLLLSHPLLPVLRPARRSPSIAVAADSASLPRPLNPAPQSPRSLSQRHHRPNLHPTCDFPGESAQRREDELHLPASAAAVAAAIRRASHPPAEIVHRPTEPAEAGVCAPSPEFHRLCAEQLGLFRSFVHSNAVLSVYVRPAGSYIMDQLELKRVAFSPSNGTVKSEETVSLVANFVVTTGLRSAESSLVKQEIEVVPEHNAVVLPMVKYPFVVGFLVVELPETEIEAIMILPSIGQHASDGITNDQSIGLPSSFSGNMLENRAYKGSSTQSYLELNTEWIPRAAIIARSLAVAYIMDQKALLLQQTSWQNSIRMNHLIEQIRGPLSSIRALAKMLSPHVKTNEIPSDIIAGIITQGDHIKDTLQQIQDAVHLTKANIVRYNNEHERLNQEGISKSGYAKEEILFDNLDTANYLLPGGHDKKDIVMPMPPLWLAPVQQQDTRSCSISELLEDLVGAAEPVARRQQRIVEISGASRSLQVPIEESSLRQALSNLIEGALLRTQIGGKVQIYAGGAPAGGVLVVIDDDGPDMQYMTQMHSLTPFGVQLTGDGMLEDNMTWNFIAGLTIAREILEGYGCVVRVVSPLKPDSAIGTGGNRIELWFPAVQTEVTNAGTEVQSI